MVLRVLSGLIVNSSDCQINLGLVTANLLISVACSGTFVEADAAENGIFAKLPLDVKHGLLQFVFFLICFVSIFHSLKIIDNRYTVVFPRCCQRDPVALQCLFGSVG